MTDFSFDARPWVESLLLQPGTPKDAGKEIKQNIDAAVLELLGDVKDKRVLDVGAGCGVLAKKLLERGARVALLDADLLQLMLARAYIGQNPGVLYLVGDAAATNIVGEEKRKSGSAFHLAVCSEVLEHLPRPEACVDAVLLALNRGGAAVFTAPHKSTGETDDFQKNLRNPKPCLTVGGPAYTFDHLRTYDEDEFKRLLMRFGTVEEVRLVTGRDDKGVLHASIVSKVRKP